MSQEGNGTSHGVNYAYTLSKDSTCSWCYECRVHKNFLDSSSDELVVKNFQIEGHAWCLELTNSSGNLGAYIRNVSKCPRGAHVVFRIVNHTNSKFDKDRGCYHKFEHNQTWGYSNLIAIANIKDTHCGFLNGDIFVMRVFLRLDLPELESFAVNSDGMSSRCTWRLKGLHGKNSWIVDSEEFTIGKLKWQLGVYPDKMQLGEKNLYVYVMCTSDVVVQAEGSLSLVKQCPTNKNFTREFVLKFGGDGDYWQSFYFEGMNGDATHGYIIDDWITLSVDISVKDQSKKATNSETTESIRAVYGKEGAECLHCNVKVQTSGVLHGDSAHKCYCLECARSLKKRHNIGHVSLATFLRKRNVLECPICGKKVERIIEKMV